jgi:dihydropteroate synthase
MSNFDPRGMSGCNRSGFRRIAAPWRLRTRTLELGRRTLVMGIVNITPDSFSDGGLYFDTEAAVAHALALLDEGADLLDLGAESTRPGSRAGSQTGLQARSQARLRAENPRGAAGSAEAPVVSADEEQARLLPVLEGILRERPQAVVSVDTYKAATARAVLRAGAEIINDVSGFGWDAEMASVCAEAERFPGLVLMHTRGRPEEWRSQPKLAPDELMAMVRAGLAASLAAATAAGIPLEAIVLDPGYGFGKRFEENYALLARQSELLELGRPLLAGLSRKSFLGGTLAPLRQGGNAPVGALIDAPVEARETASVAALVAAILHGASVVRVHAVRPAVEAARIADAVLAAGAAID